MKIERLLGIITFLLNRELVTGKDLAEKFEVSERTIQRDIESINMAGIPIVSLRGANGGYQIMDHFRFSKQTSSDEDIKTIKSALETWVSVMDHEIVHSTLEKINSLNPSNQRRPLSIDFSVAKENKKVQDRLATIEEAITHQRILEFIYTNATNIEKKHVIEPVALKFKWYAWYLVGYHIEKEKYIIYKISRMKELSDSKRSFERIHCNQTDYFEDLMQNDTRTFTSLVIQLNRSIFVSFSEYFNSFSIVSESEKGLEVELQVIESERYWFALLLSFGVDIEIMSPSSIREKFYTHTKKMCTLYDKPDR